MKRPRRRNPVVLALWANAILLGGVLVVLLTRGNYPSMLSPAFGQNQAPIAGGAGVFVMPCQLGDKQWGAYLLDVDAGTLVVYQYEPGVRKLSFVAARTYKYDRRLHDMSTSPPTDDIRRLVEREQQGSRRAEEAPPAVAPEPVKDK
jgi:hypothetical protein